MIGLDTNVLARYFVEEAVADSATPAQRQAARQLIESGQELFLPKTVALELEWVLRGYYGFAVESVLQVFEQLLHHPCLSWMACPCVQPLQRWARCSPWAIRPWWQVAGEQQVAVGAGVVAEEVAGMQTWRLRL